MRIMFMARFCKTLKMVLWWFSPCHGVQKGCWKSTTSEATSLLSRFRNPASPTSFRQFQGFIASILKRRLGSESFPKGFRWWSLLHHLLDAEKTTRQFPKHHNSTMGLNSGPLEMAEKIYGFHGFFVPISGSYRAHLLNLWLVVGAGPLCTCPHFSPFSWQLSSRTLQSFSRPGRHWWELQPMGTCSYFKMLHKQSMSHKKTTKTNRWKRQIWKKQMEKRQICQAHPK